jgi:cytochrome c oxidase assembly protein subunit 11
MDQDRAQTDTHQDTARRNRRMLLGSLGVAAGMVGLSFAAVPLYDAFCRLTGFGGTPMLASEMPQMVGERQVTVRFNADVNRDLAWRFAPDAVSVKLLVGEAGEIKYRATNLSDKPVVGTATYNITPEKAAVYFNKVECFCFTRQLLQPGETAEMPVTYFVDPAIADDPKMRDVDTITLSYTFFKAADQNLDGTEKTRYQNGAQAAAAPAATSGNLDR